MNYQQFKEKFPLAGQLNKQQDDAVQSIDGPVLLFAVPGSGKTTVIITRLAYMIYCCNIPADKILTITFTVAAAEDMEKRFKSRFAIDGFNLQLTFSTINAFCYKVIRYYCHKKHKDMPKFADEGVFNKIILEYLLSCFEDTYIQKSTVSCFKTYISQAKNMCVSLSESKNIKVLEYPGFDFKKLYSYYENTKREKQVFDFDDQLSFAYSILKNNPDILAHFQSKYTYINVDEAQDTSYIQHEIIRLLATKNIFMVGDDDQSIYGFRAAFPDALLNFETTYLNAKIIKMETNYRSTGEIVSAANLFIKQNKKRHPKNMKTPKEMGSSIKKLHLLDAAEQYKVIYEIVSNNKEDTIAILFRNNESAVPLIDYFENRNFKYKMRDAGVLNNFLTSPVPTDIANILKLALNPTNIELFSMIYHRIGFIKKEYMQKAVKLFQTSGDFSSVLAALDNVMKENDCFCNYDRAFKELALLTPTQSIQCICDKLEYIYKTTKNSGFSESTIQQKISTLVFLSRSDKTVAEFLMRIERLKDLKIYNDSNSLITLSTMHSSKGLEFDKVIIIDVYDGVLPCDFDDNEDSIEEERRLFYVGATRAKSELIFIVCNRANGVILPPSSFIKKLTYKISEQSIKNSYNSAVYSRLSSAARAKQQLNKKTSIIPEHMKRLNEFIVGTKIYHKSWKEGEIISVKVKDNAVLFKVDFALVGIKELSLEICLKNNIITIVK